MREAFSSMVPNPLSELSINGRKGFTLSEIRFEGGSLNREDDKVEIPTLQLSYGFTLTYGG